MIPLTLKTNYNNITFSPNWNNVAEDNKPHIYFTIGLPRSGKSTFVDNEMVGQLTGNLGEPVIINGDDFRMAGYGQRFNEAGEGLVAGAVFTAIKALLITGYNVIYDETNTSPWSLKKIFSIDPMAQYVIIDKDVDICVQRTNEALGVPIFPDEQEEFLNAIDRINAQFKKITINKLEKLRQRYL